MLERSKELGRELAAGVEPIEPGLDASSQPSVKARAGHVSLRLDWAEEELREGHAACLGVDKEFAHEICQLLFAVGAIKQSWKARLEREGSLGSGPQTSFGSNAPGGPGA